MIGLSALVLTAVLLVVFSNSNREAPWRARAAQIFQICGFFAAIMAGTAALGFALMWLGAR